MVGPWMTSSENVEESKGIYFGVIVHRFFDVHQNAMLDEIGQLL